MNNKKPEDQSKTKRNLIKEIPKKPLPWWVEILFVQIGLPDKWLRKLLDLKKNINLILKDNQQQIGLAFLLLLGAVYIHPIVHNSRANINCQKNFLEIYTNTDKNRITKSKYKKMLATNFCNGSSNQIK
tara:strand:+ start:4155 stop:4541 length:387 start_codon:yes stop_codon:yes gene_type:complete